MKAAFGCEVIGRSKDVLWKRDLRQYRPWVALITGRCPRYDYQREFVFGKNDYRDVNKRDTRGAIRWFTLTAGNLYQACYYTKWQVMERIFVTVDETSGDIVEIPEREIPEWMDRLFGPAPKLKKRTTVVRRS